MPPLIGRSDHWANYGAGGEPTPNCIQPPRGWTCMRFSGHHGPCEPRPSWWNLREWWLTFKLSRRARRREPRPQ